MTYFGRRAVVGDMQKYVYDTNDDGIVDNSASTANHASKHKKSGADEIDCAGLAGRVNYVDRGDVADFDFTIATLTADDNWHDLVLSSIIPVGVVSVNFGISTTPTSLPGNVLFRKKGYTGNRNIFVWRCVVATLTHEFCFFIPPDSNRIVEYNATEIPGGWTNLNITVLGWLI